MEISLKTYDHLFRELADDRVYNWPLMSGPWMFLTIVVTYLYAIYRVLPSYMEYRKPFNLKTLIAAYNVFQMMSCLLLTYGILTSGWTTYYSLGCQAVDYSKSDIAMRMANFMWWHMILKMIELVETIFFILRKKHNQVSSLHVYHHVSTFYFAWVTAKYMPGGMVTFTVIPNSIVHVIMYGYYFLSSLGPPMQSKLAKFKSKITTIQLVQLVIILVHTLQALPASCSVSKTIPFIYILNIMINIALFIRFYRLSYVKKRKPNVN